MPNEVVVTAENVRAAIDISLDEKVLPDSIIELGIYAGAAIRVVKDRDADWATRTGTQAERLNEAADLFTASRAVFAIPNITSETSAQSSGYQRKAIDPEMISELLIARAIAAINTVLDVDNVAVQRPMLFGLACGRRGL